ncbi:hypothetical protein Q0Z83_054890 [Actinoplanes sichuanensis]|nr:hypothetical protein Q0Z83_054890 [Actinoplanes sichuanensis]
MAVEVVADGTVVDEQHGPGVVGVHGVGVFVEVCVQHFDDAVQWWPPGFEPVHVKIVQDLVGALS